MKKYIFPIRIFLPLLFFIGCGSEQKNNESMQQASVKVVRVAIAPIDEIYFGLGNPNNRFMPYDNLTESDLAKYDMPVKARRNASYVWGAAQTGSEIWFGSLNNAWYGWMVKHLRLPIAVSAFQTEIEASNLTAPPAPGQLYIFNTKKENIEIIDPKKFKNAVGCDFAKELISGPTGYRDGKFIGQSPKTYGFRAAGSFDGIVFFIGHAILGQQSVKESSDGYLRIFAFEAATRTYLGSADFLFDSARRMIGLKHPDGSSALYTFMGPDQTLGQAGTAKTIGLRWVATNRLKPFEGGQINGFDIITTDDFNFEGAPGEFAIANDKQDRTHLVVSTWAHPKAIKEPSYRGGNLLLSNTMPSNGFSKTNPVVFSTLFRFEDFDADPAIAKGYEMGAMAMFDGYLYFGSMHLGQSSGADKLRELYPQQFPVVPDGVYSTTEQELAIKAWRSASIFRMKLNGFDQSTKFVAELLYGEEKQWTFDGTKWSEKPNRMGLKPLYGSSGWGKPLNVYTWTAIVHDEKLYIGGFDVGSGMNDYYMNASTPIHNKPGELGRIYPDHFYMADGKVIPVEQMTGKPWQDIVRNNPMSYVYEWAKTLPGEHASGAPMIVFENTHSPAKIVTLTGFGNAANNGVRNAAIVDGKLYIGTSTYSNLGNSAGLEFYEISY